MPFKCPVCFEECGYGINTHCHITICTDCASGHEEALMRDEQLGEQLLLRCTMFGCKTYLTAEMVTDYQTQATEWPAQFQEAKRKLADFFKRKLALLTLVVAKEEPKTLVNQEELAWAGYFICKKPSCKKIFTVEEDCDSVKCVCGEVQNVVPGAEKGSHESLMQPFFSALEKVRPNDSIWQVKILKRLHPKAWQASRFDSLFETLERDSKANPANVSRILASISINWRMANLVGFLEKQFGTAKAPVKSTKPAIASPTSSVPVTRAATPPPQRPTTPVRRPSVINASAFVAPKTPNLETAPAAKNKWPTVKPVTLVR